MHFSYFKTLALPWQAHIICECGTRIAERVNNSVIIDLYQIDSFYVEVHYRKSDNEIMKITSFQDIYFLEPYMNTILLPSISPRIVKK